MTDLLQDLEAYFISEELATMVYRDTMLESNETSIALYEYPGENGIAQVAGALRNVQIVTRDKNATVAKQKARALYNSLVTEDSIISLTTERWCLIHLKQVPFKLKVDDKDRVFYCFNVSLVTYND